MTWLRNSALVTTFLVFPAFALEPGSLASERAGVYLGPAPWLDPNSPPSPSPPGVPKAVLSVPPIDTSDRAAVVAAYNTYYNLAMPAVGFTGSTATCMPGTITLAFQEWTISRINFLRAMAGVSGNTQLDSGKNAQEQAAALIMAAAGILTHTPANTLPCWTQAGADGAGSSNLALGMQLQDSIPAYMSDFGGGNHFVGHRRWILDSRKASFGMGQANGTVFNANALYVFQRGASVSIPNGIAWPPMGFVPMALFPTPIAGEGPRWSFGMPNANFAAANVSMTLNGAPLALTVKSRTDNGYADNTIVWELPTGHAVARNTVYTVSISGVTNAASSSYTYQVIAFNPADAPATFPVTLMLGGSGSGVVTSTPAGIHCGATCSVNFPIGASVTFTATPAAGSAFSGWSGACSGSGVCTVSVDSAKNVVATFAVITVPAAPNYTALWWNPAESGWGINLNHQGNILFATLFTYDASGAPMWLVMSAGTLQTGTTYTGDLYRTTGPPFNAVPFTPITAANLAKVGTMTVTFSSADAATLIYTANGFPVTKSIQRQVFGSRAANCAPTGASRASLANYQDLWWNANESGWGVNVTHQDNTLFATLFTYEAAGNGLWLVMSAGTRQMDGSFLGDLYRTTGPPFNAQPFTPIGSANLTKVGTMQFRFTSGESGTLTYSVNAANVTKAITRQVFSSPVPACG